MSIQEGLNALTNREREIAHLLAGGLSNKGIARLLGITDGTVKVHLHNVFQKLGIENRTTLVAMVVKITHGKE